MASELHVTPEMRGRLEAAGWIAPPAPSAWANVRVPIELRPVALALVDAVLRGDGWAALRRLVELQRLARAWRAGIDRS